MKRVLPATVALIMVAGACSSAETTEPTDPPQTTATTASAPATETTTAEAVTTTQAPATTAPAAAQVITVSETDLGTILVDGAGLTLYLFIPDDRGESVCYDQCATTWPPLTGDFSAGNGVEDSLLGTADRTDGTSQVTYGGWPLYYFAGDAAAGDTNGQGLNEVWFVVSPSGEAIG